MTTATAPVFDTYTPAAFDFPTLPAPCRWAGGWQDGTFTIEVHADDFVVYLNRWDVDECLSPRFPAQAETVIATAARRARRYAAAVAATRRYAPPPAASLWPICPPPASNELR